MMKQKPIKCPYCHANASLRPASVVYGLNRRSQGKFLYLCDRWPACDAYVSAHDRTHRPMGTLANGDLRHKRILAHRALEQLRQSRERCAALEEQVFRQTAEQYRNAGDVLLVQPDMEPDSVRRLCDAVSGTCGGRCAVFAGTGGSYRWAVIHPGQDLRAFIRDMNQALHSRGGGRDGFAQGSAACTEEELRAFFAQ